MTDAPPIAVMDATCALCSFGARMLHRIDRSGDIRICPIQTARGQAMLLEHGLDPNDPDSWLFVERGQVWTDFDAIIRIGERSGGVGYLLSCMRLMPGPVRRWLYARIATNRYAWFGRGDMCSLPDPDLRARFIA